MNLVKSLPGEKRSLLVYRENETMRPIWNSEIPTCIDRYFSFPNCAWACGVLIYVRYIVRICVYREKKGFLSVAAFMSLCMYFVHDLTGQLKLTPKGYVNKWLIKVSAPTAVQLFSSNVSTPPSSPEPRRLPKSRSSLRSRRRRSRSRCNAGKRKEDWSLLAQAL